MVPVRRLYVVALAFALGALGCLVMTLVRHDHLEDTLVHAEGAYFSRSFGRPSFFSGLSGSVFDPFHPGNAYLWLGATVALALASAIVLLLARTGRPT